MSEISLICAMDDNRLIGKDNAMPWHLPADLAFFKKTTMDKPILMGRKTYQSIGRALPGRQNIIITRDTSFEAQGCDIATSIEHALELCQYGVEVMFIGGASLYQQTIEMADKLYITQVHASFDGDTWFPEIDENLWQIDSQEDFESDEKNPYNYSYVTYSREKCSNLR